MIMCEGGEISYSGKTFELVSDVATVVFATRDILAKDCPEQLREQFCKEYERIILSVLAAPCCEEQGKAAHIIRSVLKNSEKDP